MNYLFQSRCSLVAVLLLLLSSHAFSQKQYNVLDWKTDATVNTYLIQQLHKEYDQRRMAFTTAVSSKASAKKYIAAIQNKFQQLIGEMPELSPLNAITTGKIEVENYTIEKIIYESFENHHVTANLYLPKQKGVYPAAILFCGHEDVSKATPSYQQTAILLVKNGFVVLVIDPISQSERYQLTDKVGKPLTRGGTTEHTLLNESTNLLGSSTAAYQLWDNKRGLDYLIARPEVDTNRIGCLGNSGGGMQTIYFAAFDKRIKVFAPNSYLSSRERTLEMTGPADGCAQIPNEGKLQLELNDFLIAAATKPVLILAGRYDFIDYTGTVVAYEEIKKIYTALGQSQKIKLFTYDDGHGLSQPKREATVTWLRKWLYNDSTAVSESPANILTDKELFSTKTGQVNTEFPNEKSIAQRNVELFEKYSQQRNIFLQQPSEKIKAGISELLALHNNKNLPDAQEIGVVNNQQIIYHKIILRKPGLVPLPLLLAIPDGEIKKIIVWASDTGKNKIADSLQLIQSYLANGCAVILADLRGVGETQDKAELNEAKFYNKEYRNAMFALHIGQPMAGQRTDDLLAIFSFIQLKNWTNIPVEINASGICALPALHAALFAKNVDHLNLYHFFTSFKTILDNPIEKDWYSYVIPGVLKLYDIPDLVKIIGSTKVSFK